MLAPEVFAARLPRHVMSACVLVTDPADRILMLHQAHGYPGHPPWWQLPGGLADLDEKPHQTALREAYEESGIELPAAPRLRVVDYRSSVDGWPPVIDFCFDAGRVPTDTPVVLSAEHDRAAWRSHAEWQPHLQPDQRDWFASVWRARTAGVVLHLNDGREL
ncbi:NUDIX domain-containing protein [Streptacidiphilus jiangxiensis]|uniref:8-oxo-dGTP pyrophosphatase MutT, NUDIX family n=1 Tax=Streptacidiphilus jiangxiensis TaxID=235985 RepID=A0A1H7USM1_STRJI|nr:NUDIX hydrolase [Streptacidiphilus jiangxiensis]SEL99953.1 8-oxo-dGTP pyrophosphatase MutT, NUDIX family [Streptacidiphilus jiangxiensis]